MHITSGLIVYPFSTREIVGVMAYLERYMVEAEERGNPFIINLLEKQHSRLRLVFDRHVVSNYLFFVLATS